MEILENPHEGDATDAPMPVKAPEIPDDPPQGLPPQAQVDEPWPEWATTGGQIESSSPGIEKSVIPEQVAERFPALVAAKEDGRNQMHALRYEHEARTFINPDNLREVPSVEYVKPDGRHGTVLFDAMAHDGTLIDRKLRSPDSSFDRDQLRNQSEALRQLSERTGVTFHGRWEVSDPGVAGEVQRFIDKNGIQNISVVHVPPGTDSSAGRDFAHLTDAEMAVFYEHWRSYPDESGKNIGVRFVTDRAPDGAKAYLYEWDARQACGWTDERYRPALPSPDGGHVRFDAVDLQRGLLIDRKVAASSDMDKAARAQNEALEYAEKNHPGTSYMAVWQVPNERVEKSINKMLAANDITRIKVEVVPYDGDVLMNAWLAANSREEG